MEFNTDIFSQFDRKWGLVTAGNEEAFNTMTVSWGGMGTIWGKPVATVYVRTSRYTHEFMDREGYFTVSFYPEECRKAMAVMGTKSGRDINKDEASGLTIKPIGQVVTYEEAEVTIICRKIYWQDLVRENMPEDAVERFYTEEEPHRMFIGEVVEIIKK
jgi:flavin reductase (DIM6/NTAB) family NADH-FMN oxidoreductase RutF